MDASQQDTVAVISPIKVFLMTTKNDRLQQRFMQIVNKHTLFLECPELPVGSPNARTPQAAATRPISHDLRSIRVSTIDSATEK